jgi:hypothetical protein
MRRRSGTQKRRAIRFDTAGHSDRGQLAEIIHLSQSSSFRHCPIRDGDGSGETPGAQTALNEDHLARGLPSLYFGFWILD